jgi:hypothetical protein
MAILTAQGIGSRHTTSAGNALTLPSGCLCIEHYINAESKRISGMRMVSPRARLSVSSPFSSGAAHSLDRTAERYPALLEEPEYAHPHIMHPRSPQLIRIPLADSTALAMSRSTNVRPMR